MRHYSASKGQLEICEGEQWNAHLRWDQSGVRQPAGCETILRRQRVKQGAQRAPNDEVD